MDIACTVSDTGLELHIDDRSFPLKFPADVWKAFPDKQLLADNFAFLKSLHLPEILARSETLNIDNSYPLFKHQIASVVLNYLPLCADVDGQPTAERLRRYLAQDFQFRDYTVRYPRAGWTLEDRAVLNMSFGKDSLLTYGVARELGLPMNLIMTVENDGPLELPYKLDIARRFSAEFDENVALIENDTSIVHRYEYWGTGTTNWGYAHLITEYLFNTLPFSHHHNARYVLLGNERECDDPYTGHDGYLCWPVFDQSVEWLLEMSKMGTTMAGDRMQVMSLIEPLYGIAILRILHVRYPEIGKYQMSCFPDETEHGKQHFWCGHCSKCARNFLYFHACGIDPAGVGFKTDMFEPEFRDLYSVFGRKVEVGKVAGYDASPSGIDQQLLAFLLAFQRGVRGALMDLFREQRLAEAGAREQELRARFLGVHPARSIPPDLADSVHALYSEVLAD